MPIHVKLPDGNIGEFPDGMSDDAIAAVLQKQFPPQKQQTSALAPGDESTPFGVGTPAGYAGKKLWEFGKGAVAGVQQIVAHPLDTVRSMGEQTVAGGWSPNGYPIFAPTLNADRDKANLDAQKAAQLHVGQGVQQSEDHPFYTAGTVVGPAVATAGIMKAAEVALPKVAARVSPRGAMSSRMAETPVGEQFSRQQVLDAARDNGVNLDLAQATDSGVAHALKKANRYSIASQGTYDAAQTKNLNALEDWANKTTDSLAPTGASREVVGGQLQSALKNHLEARKAVATQAFQDLDKTVGNNKVDVTGNLQDAAKAIINENKSYFAEHPELKPKQAWGILEDLAKSPDVEVKTSTPGLLDASGQEVTNTAKVPATTKKMSWSDLHQLRSDLMDFYRNNPDIIKGRGDAWIQQMVGKVDEALTQAGSGLSGEDLAKFRSANDTWQSIKSTYDNPQSPYYHAVRSQYPSQVPGMLSKGTPELAQQVRATLGSLEGPFQRQFAENLLNGKDGMTLDLKNLNSRIGRVPQDFLVSMLGEDGAKNLRMLGKVAAKVTADSNPSGTAKVGVPAAEIGSLFSINAPGAAAEMGAQFVGAKALNSPKVVDFFTKP